MKRVSREEGKRSEKVGDVARNEEREDAVTGEKKSKTRVIVSEFPRATMKDKKSFDVRP